MTDFSFEENQGRLKLVIPVSRNWWLFALFSACLVVWMGMLIAIVAALFRERYMFVLTVMLIVWLVIWIWFGRVLWHRWQYHAAGREILFADDDRLIIRRPVSLLGSTEVYDVDHVTPFYFSDKHGCPAFDYGYQHVYFGETLERHQGQAIVQELNRRLFPNLDDA